MSDELEVQPAPPLGSETGMGRLIALDPRDKNYPIRSIPRTSIQSKHRYWVNPLVLDQGNSSECVAYSAFAYLMSSPVYNFINLNTTQLYYECQKVDEWEGEDYDGTSVRACFKILKQIGYIREYRWATRHEDVISHLLTKGPVVLGTTWYMNMFDVDREGFVSATGDPSGGHAYLLIGVNTEKKCPDGSKGAVRILNSWGRGWGDNGRAWMSFNDLQLLIDDYGEACVAVEEKL